MRESGGVTDDWDDDADDDADDDTDADDDMTLLLMCVRVCLCV